MCNLHSTQVTHRFVSGLFSKTMQLFSSSYLYLKAPIHSTIQIILVCNKKKAREKHISTTRIQ